MCRRRKSGEDVFLRMVGHEAKEEKKEEITGYEAKWEYEQEEGGGKMRDE